MVEGSHLPATTTLKKLSIPRATFYPWYDRYRDGGLEALADHRSRPDRVWNDICDKVRELIIELALDGPEPSPRELAVRFTDERRYFVSGASVYRLLRAHDLITSPAYVVIKAADEFKDKTPPEPALADRLHLPEDHRLGAGTTSRRCWTTSPATSWPGSCAAPCEPTMSPTRSTWRSRPRGSITSWSSPPTAALRQRQLLVSLKICQTLVGLGRLQICAALSAIGIGDLDSVRLREAVAPKRTTELGARSGHRTASVVGPAAPALRPAAKIVAVATTTATMWTSAIQPVICSPR